MKIALYLKYKDEPIIINNCTNHGYFIEYNAFSMHFKETIDREVATTLIKNESPLMVVNNMGAYSMYVSCRDQLISIRATD